MSETAKPEKAQSKVEPANFELPKELVEQYKTALGGITDVRLLVLLLFNSFEEVMKSFAAWRLRLLGGSATATRQEFIVALVRLGTCRQCRSTQTM